MGIYRYILALDPSGAFYEGKGTTGYCLYDEDEQTYTLGYQQAKDFRRMEEFWDAHIQTIEDLSRPNMMVVIEDYLLYAHKANEQINSRMETSKLIGILQHYCWHSKRPYYMQTAGEVKPRWTDEILAHKGILIPRNRGYALCSDPKKAVNRHCKDALRHAVHYATFKNKGARIK